jgi:hypothetical protein
MASYQDCVEDVPWKNLKCTLSPSSMHVIQQRKYLRTSAIPTGTDVKLYDVGNFFVATTGGANTDSIGKLYVEYEVEFYIPQKTSTTSSGQSFAYRQASQSLSTGVKLLASPTSIIAAGTAPTAGAFIFPAGNWQISYRANYNSTTGDINLFVTPYVNGVASSELIQRVPPLISPGQKGSFDLLFVLSFTESKTVDFRVDGASTITVDDSLLVASALC